MSEQRIERWAARYRHNGVLTCITFNAEAEADRECANHEMDKIRLVEIREGEEIVGPGLSASAFALDDMRRERDAMTERAEKAEVEVTNLRKAMAAMGEMAAADSKERESVREENEKLRAMVNGEWKTDERARFERECAMHLFAENNIREDYDIKDCFSDARELADHYFGAKEAK